MSKMILWRSFFWKSSFFISSFGFERVFLSFVLTCVGRAVSTAFCLSIAPVRGEILCVKQFFLAPFSDTDRKFIGLCSNFFQPSWWHCFLRVRKINLKTNNCFDNFFNLFFHPSRTLNDKKRFFFGGKPINRFVKPAYDFSRRSFEELFLRKGSFFALHWQLSNFFLAYRQKILCGVAKTALCLSIATSCGKKKTSVKNIFLP